MSRPEQTDAAAQPAWMAGFLEALKAGKGVRRAAEIAGVATSTAYDWRARDAEFAYVQCLLGFLNYLMQLQLRADGNISIADISRS